MGLTFHGQPRPISQHTTLVDLGDTLDKAFREAGVTPPLQSVPRLISLMHNDLSKRPTWGWDSADCAISVRRDDM